MEALSLEAKLTINSDEYDRRLKEASQKMDAFGNGATGMAADAKKAEKAVDDAADSLAGYSRDADRAEGAADDAGDAMKDAGRAAETAGDGAKSGGNGFEDLASKIEGAVMKGNLLSSALEGLWNGLKELAKEVWNMDEATEEFRLSQSKLETAFDNAGFSSKTAKKAFSSLYATLGDTDQATEASQLLARLAKSSEDVSAWTKIAAGVVGTFGDSLPIESLIEAANETANVGQVTGTLADALNWVGISEDEFNAKLAECESTTQRVNLITSTLAATYSDAADAYNENNAAIIAARDNSLKLQEAQAGIGTEVSRLKTALTSALMPAIELVFSGVTKIVSKLADWSEAWARIVKETHEPLDMSDVEAAREEYAALTAQLEAMEAADKSYWEYINYQELDALRLQVAYAGEQLEEFDYQQAAAAEEAANLAAAEGDVADSVERIILAGYDVTDVLEQQGISAEEAASRLNAYTTAATDMFNRINTESSATIAEMTANLNFNAQAVEDWSTNLGAIAGKIPEELYNSLVEGGVSNMAGAVAELANSSEEELAALSEAYENAGAAANEAFLTSLGAVPSDADNPVTEMAKQIEADTTLETATTAAVNRAYESASTASDSFNIVGQNIINRMIKGLNDKSSALYLRIKEIVAAALKAADDAANGGGNVTPSAAPSSFYDGAGGTSSKTNAGGGITVVQNIESVPQTPVELAAATEAYFEQARWAFA